MVHAPDGNATYVVEKPLGGTNFVHSVRRVSDGELFIAKEFNADIVPELVGLRQETRPDNIVAFEAAARVLNHENLISVVKSMWTAPVVPVSKGGVANEWSVVYEWCAKGTLKEILDHPAMEPTAQGFLPEGLVWHVTLSILRALAFLHEGKRERVVLSEDGLRLERTWYCLDDDWMPILHRAIEPENIHFQARKGKESYGLCKLGNFSRCYVSGLARDPADDNSQEVLATFNNLAQPDPKQEEVRAWWAQAHADGEQPNWRGQMPSHRAYTTGNELAALGEVLYHMMKGRRLRAHRECIGCGCFHVDPDEPCVCDCPFRDMILEHDFGGSKYSVGLRDVVVGLVHSNWQNHARAVTWYGVAFERYLTWKKETADGMAHADHFDDMAARRLAQRRNESRKLAELKQVLGDWKPAEQQLAKDVTDERPLVWS